MVKINCCDICYKEGKIREAKKYITVKGRRELRVDYCDECKSKIPENMVEYVKFCYVLKGINLTDEEAQKMLR